MPRKVRITKDDLAKHEYTPLGTREQGAPVDDAPLEIAVPSDAAAWPEGELEEPAAAPRSPERFDMGTPAKPDQQLNSDEEFVLEGGPVHRSDARSPDEMPVNMGNSIELDSQPTSKVVRFPIAHRASASTRRHEHTEPEGAQAPESPEHKRNGRPEPSSPTATYRSDVEFDLNIELLTEMDRQILASALLNVDVTEVYGPIWVNEFAAKFGLVPGSSLDLTNGWDSEKGKRSAESMA